MKHLIDYEKDLNKCSKCGLCQSVCPLFKLSKNDCAVSKGKFIMLHGVVKGDLKLSDNINKYLDMCLRCGKCTRFCPAGIDACQIINHAKSDYMHSKIVRYVINFLQNRVVFNFFINLFSCIFGTFNRPKRYKCKNPQMKVLYFKGCINKIFPQNDEYINKIFSQTDIEIIEPNFDCCGLPFLSDGNLARFEQAAKFNIEKMNSDFDYLVTDCVSCEDTILNYSKYIEDFEINPSKSLNWGNLIAYKNIKFEFKNHMKVTFHKPCHLRNDAFLGKIFENCSNVEYIKCENYDECCGFAGSFGLKNPFPSYELLNKKAENIINTGAEYVITTCPSCTLGLKLALFLNKAQNVKVVSLLKFLSMADKIIY